VRKIAHWIKPQRHDHDKQLDIWCTNAVRRLNDCVRRHMKLDYFYLIWWAALQYTYKIKSIHICRGDHGAHSGAVSPQTRDLAISFLLDKGLIDPSSELGTYLKIHHCVNWKDPSPPAIVECAQSRALGDELSKIVGFQCCADCGYWCEYDQDLYP
jgi:hypothetical protein